MKMFVALPLGHLPLTDTTDLLESINVTDTEGKPITFPELKENEAVICCAVSTETFFQCGSLYSMQETYNRLTRFLEYTLQWYRCVNYTEFWKRLKAANT